MASISATNTEPSEKDNKESERNSQKTGFDCEFVEKPPSVLESECPVCLQILCEPYQVMCCGKSYCRICIGKIKTERQPCPTCNEEKIKYFPNKGLKQILYQFKVRCTHQKEGCEWTGELGELDNHLNINPEPEKRFEGCAYTKIECQYNFAGCMAQLLRKQMKAHIQSNTKNHFTLLEAKYSAVSCKLESIQANIQTKFPTPPITFKMTKYKHHRQEKQQWESPFFYTHLRGSKMKLQVNVGIKRFPNYLSVNLVKVSGEFDGQPGTIYCNKQMEIAVVSQVPWQPNKKVVIAYNSNRTNGTTFENQESVHLVELADIYMYIKDDCIEFQIADVENSSI